MDKKYIIPKKKPKKDKEEENNLDDLPRGLKMDTTTNSSGTTRKFNMGGSSSCGCEACMGESKARGAGAAISGTGFKGVF